MTESGQDAGTRTAFLALDFAAYIVENFSHDDGVARQAAAALAAARQAGLPVLHVVPDGMQEQIHPLLAPAADETLLGKSSFSAFATTDLDERLRAAGVGQLIVAGVATSGTVLSTTRWAVDIGYQVIVCADACADPDAQAHAALVDERVFPRSWLGLWRIARVLPGAQISELAS
ncbi:MAG TPA: cysteine hydrolase [Streptosporangiaceae bacterium]|jgi:nicotinamidase-related amidase|nr:cysteine hydrolase [Streptosporangiaceae bacterium]